MLSHHIAVSLHSQPTTKDLLHRMRRNTNGKTRKMRAHTGHQDARPSPIGIPTASGNQDDPREATAS
jgi:hypothetical protein